MKRSPSPLLPGHGFFKGFFFLSPQWKGHLINEALQLGAVRRLWLCSLFRVFTVNKDVLSGDGMSG